MECHRRGYQWTLRRLAWRRQAADGQSTVEFALVTAALLVVVLVSALLWRQLEEGLFVEHALSSASHHVELAAPGTIADVFLY